MPSSSALEFLPDALCLLRAALGLVFVAAVGRASGVALAVAVGAAATDFIDGRIARRLGSVSARGAIMDVGADAAFVLCGLGALAAQDVIPLSVPLAAAVSLAALAHSWARTGGFRHPTARGPADLLGHGAGIGNYAVVLAASGLLFGGAPTDWLRSLSYALVPLNLAPLLLRVLRSRAHGATEGET